MSRPVLQVVTGSTRPGRVGAPVAEWFRGRAAAHGAFDVEAVDLAEVDLPMLDEPNHPRLQQYEHQHTRDWSATVARADAFVLVVPEYNFSYNAATKNALDFLHGEWRDKAVGFVGYGGIAGGTRAVQALKQVVQALRMTAVYEGVYIPFVAQYLDDERRFRPTEVLDASADAMLDELLRVTPGLMALRGIPS